MNPTIPVKREQLKYAGFIQACDVCYAEKKFPLPVLEKIMDRLICPKCNRSWEIID